jgi:hypothetical protein
MSTEFGGPMVANDGFDTERIDDLRDEQNYLRSTYILLCA